MKKQLLLLFTAILSLNCYSQISFEKGYYIDNANQKIECLIKNNDWRNNPTEFEYKFSENSETKIATVKTIKEFTITNVSKYIRSTVNIDRSDSNIDNLSKDKNPIFNEEKLFLKVLIEGKSNLYEYVDSNLKRYFYLKENSNIEQLIFKKYQTVGGDIATNNGFRQQLWTDLKCPTFTMSKIQNLDYNKNELVKFFTEYSNCENKELINFEPKEKSDLFNLTIRPRLNSNSLTMQNSYNASRNTDFENKIGFGLGLEAEYIFPFNKNKWAIAIEPTYQSYKSETTRNVSDVSGGVLISKVDYSSIEVPISLRHYFFLNSNSKIFVNFSYIIDLSFNSSIDFTRNDNSNLESLEVDSRNNLGIGIGYKQNDRYSLEIRYQTNRDILGSYAFWTSDYKTASIILGYSFL